MISQIDFVPGDIIKVHQKVKEDTKTRIQIFEGVVLGIRGRGENKMFTVRKLVGEIAVERIFPVNSPNIDKVQIKEHSKKKIRRAKLYYLRKTK
ncbi:MAG: 50S ribosomal protein L19 [Candidatus Levybacteria bacterium]|nr:50S ribosomal protein L19 [Candidatus Levybacteria bacterium]